MANFIGIAGNFMKEKALDRRARAIAVLFTAVLFIAFGVGWFTGYCLKGNTLWNVLLFLGVALTATFAFKFFEKQFDKQLRLSRAEENGADGERDFIKYLTDLPDTYTVVSDL
ncbi:MAG: hypothetical protein PHN85_06525, partial [Kiritimatiellae bacterium]|nr:hypothetical protein [Kiritimatiellia bacterium]